MPAAPDIHCKPMNGPRAVLRAVLVSAGALGLVQCQGRDPEALYLAADFVAARKHYNREACAELSGAEAKQCNERAKQISEALAGAANYLGKRANDRIRHSRQIQFNRYDEARRSLELALELLPEGHAARPAYAAGIERIRKTQGALEVELDERLAKLKTMLETGTYDAEVWTDIRLTFERVRVLVLAIGKRDDRPQQLARELVEKFRTHGQYEHARIATQLAEAVDTVDEAGQTHTDHELIMFGIVDHLAQQQEAARQEKIAALVREALAAFEAKKSTLAVDKAHAALKLGPSERSARQMRAILEQIEGATGQGQRAKEARRIAETSADIALVPIGEAPAPAPEDEADERAALAATARPADTVPPATDHRPAEVRLKEVVRQYERKQLYEALAGLEALYRDVRDGRERRKITQLRQVWTPDRKRLTADIVKEADRLFVLMDERCLAEYNRALRLTPEGAVADHINERIQTLQRILAY